MRRRSFEKHRKVIGLRCVLMSLKGITLVVQQRICSTLRGVSRQGRWTVRGSREGEGVYLPGPFLLFLIIRGSPCGELIPWF